MAKSEKDTKAMQNSIFDAISIVAEKKVKSYHYDQTIEATVEDTSHSDDGLYRVSYTGSTFDAYGTANSYYPGDVVYVTVPQGDFTKQKIIIGRKVDPEGLPSSTFNFKMPFDDFIALRNLTAEAPVPWDGTSIGFTANKLGRWIKKGSDPEVIVYKNSNGTFTDENDVRLTEDQVQYIAGDGEEIQVNEDYVKKLQNIQADLNALSENYSTKLRVLMANYDALFTAFEDVNYTFKKDEEGKQVRDLSKMLYTGAGMGTNPYKITWNGRQMNYLEAILATIISDFSISASDTSWIMDGDRGTTLWTKVRDQLLLPYLRAYVAGQYSKQVAEIENQEDLTEDEKKARIAILVNADADSPYEKLIPYFAWDTEDYERITRTLKERYNLLKEYLETEFYTGGNHVVYTNAAYVAKYGSTVDGYTYAAARYNKELNELNKNNRNLLWTWTGSEINNVLIETKLGISIDVCTLLGEWAPTFGQYGLRFVVTGVTKTTDEDASHSVSETFTFTNNDMYGNTYGYYTPYTQQKIIDISGLLTLDRIDCYFWQDFNFLDWGGQMIPFTRGRTIYENGVAVEREEFLDPNIIFSSLKVLLGLTADEATSDRVIVYSYDKPTYGISQEDQVKLGNEGIKAHQESHVDDKTLRFAWIHIDDQEGPVLINHETLRHAADKQSLQYWRAKIYWYKFNWEHENNNGIEADRIGGQNWEPLNPNPPITNVSTNSTDTVIAAWHAGHPDFDFAYSTVNDNFTQLVVPDYKYLTQKYRAIVLAENKPYRSETITFTNLDSSAIGTDGIKLQSVILRFMKGKTTADGTAFTIEEDPGGGNFFIYDENNNAGVDEAGTPFSQVPYYVQIWTRNHETGDYQPASNDVNFGVSNIQWHNFSDHSMIASFQPPTVAEMENSALTPITGDMTDEQVDWIKQTTRVFYVRDRWDLSFMDNTIRVSLMYQNQPFTCEHQCIFGQMGTMGSEFTIVLQQDLPKNSPMIIGEQFQVTAHVYKRGVEVPDTSYFFGWEILSPTYTVPSTNNTPALQDLFNQTKAGAAKDEAELAVGDWWLHDYDTAETEGYQRNVFKGRILNDMPLIVRCTVEHAASYALQVVKGFNLVNDATFHDNVFCWCPDRVEYKSDGSAPLVDMATFQVHKSYQNNNRPRETYLSNNALFFEEDKTPVVDNNGAITRQPVLDDFIHPHWQLYAYTWAYEDDITQEEYEDPVSGEKKYRTTSIRVHGGPNPKKEEDGSWTPGLMAGLSLQRTVGNGSEEAYDPDKHGALFTAADGSQYLAEDYNKRIITSDGLQYVTKSYIDYKFSPTTNQTGELASGEQYEYPAFWTNTGRVYKGPASWHWDPAYANKYFMFLTWTQEVTAPSNPNYKHKYWFRQAIPLTQNVYSSSLLNSWDGSLLIDEVNNAILAQMIAAGTKNSENNTFTGVVMGDWAKKGDASLDVPGMYGIKEGEQVFGLRVNGTGYIGRSGKGRIEFDGNHGLIRNSDGSCYLNLDPIIVRYADGDLGERVQTDSIVFDNYSGYSQFFLYAEVNATTDTAGTEAGNFAWAEQIMRYSQGLKQDKWDSVGVPEWRSSPKDLFVVDPSNGILTTGGVYARYGRIGKYLLLNDAGISYMEGTTQDDRYFTKLDDLTYEKNNNIIYIGQERRRNGTLIEDDDDERRYDWNYWSAKTYETGGIGSRGREQHANLIAAGQDYGRYIIWAGSKRGEDAYPKFGVEHDGTVHLTQAYVSGEIHASALVIGDEDYDEADRNRSIKTFVTNITKETDLIGSNPALLKQATSSSTPDYLISKKHGQSADFYGDGLRPGDVWYIMDESPKEVNVLKDLSGRSGTELQADFESYFGKKIGVVSYDTYTFTYKPTENDANGRAYTFSINPENGHVLYTGYIGNQKVTNKDVTQLEEDINDSNKTIASKKEALTTAKNKTQNRKESMLSARTTMNEKQQAMASWKIKLEKHPTNSNYQNQYNSTKTAYETARSTYLTRKSNYESALSAQRALENEIATLVEQNQTLQTEYHCIYGGMVSWSDAINDPGANGAQDVPVNPLAESDYNAARLIADKINNQILNTVPDHCDVLETNSSDSDTLTTAALTIGANTSYTQFIWVGGQPDEDDDNHIWRGQWVTENWEIDENWSEDRKVAMAKPVGVNAGDWINNENNLNATNVTPLKVSKKLSNDVVVTHYHTPPGWRRVGAIDASSPYDFLANATKTFNGALHSLADTLSSDLASKVQLIMQQTGQTQAEILEQIIKQRNDLANMLTNVQQEVLNTVYKSASAIRQGMDPISFFTDGNCYVYLTKDPIETVEVGTVPAGLSIIQLPDQANDGIGSAFYLNSKRMGFYRTLKDIQYAGQNIEVTVPLLAYYNGSMSLAGSLFFGLDYTNYIKTHQLDNTDPNFLLNEDGTIRDNVIDKDHFAYTDGAVTIYKNYLDGSNSRIVLGNGAIILDGLDNGFDVDGNEDSWNPGTGKRGKQEGGVPYVYIGYGGQTSDDGVIRIGKRDGRAIISIADYEFLSTQVSSTPIEYYEQVIPGANQDELDYMSTGSSEIITTYQIDADELKNNLKKLFPNMTQGFPNSKIFSMSIVKTDWTNQIDANNPDLFYYVVTYYIKSSDGTISSKNLKLPTTADGNGSQLVSTIYYNKDTDLLYATKSIETKTIQRTENNVTSTITQKTIVYSNPIKYSKKGTATNLSYSKLIKTLEVNLDDGEGSNTEVTTLGEFTVSYSYSFVTESTQSKTIYLSGDILKILQHTTATTDRNSLTGVGIIASDSISEGNGDGFIIFTPYTNNSSTSWVNKGYSTTLNNDYHWLSGWNFKGFNIYANTTFLKRRLYVDDGAFVLENVNIRGATTARYVRLASQSWVYKAIKDFMDNPIKSLAEQITEAFRLARKAISDAAAAARKAQEAADLAWEALHKAVNLFASGSAGGGVSIQAAKWTGSSWVYGQETGKLMAYHGHYHKVDISFSGSGGTVTCDKDSATSSGSITGFAAAVDARFEAGWAGVTATQLPSSKKIQIRTPGNKTHEYAADQIYDKGYIDGYKAAQSALSLTKTIDGTKATITATIAAATSGNYSAVAKTSSQTATAGTSFGTSHTRYTVSERTKPNGCTSDGTCYTVSKDDSACYHKSDVTATIS